MAVHSVEKMQRLRDLQMRVQIGEHVTKEEYHELIEWLRQDRLVRAAASKSKKKPATSPVTLEAMTQRILSSEQPGFKG